MYPYVVKWCLTRRNLFSTTEKPLTGKENQSSSERRDARRLIQPAPAPRNRGNTAHLNHYGGCNRTLLFLYIVALSWSGNTSHHRWIPRSYQRLEKRLSTMGAEKTHVMLSGVARNDVSDWFELWFKQILSLRAEVLKSVTCAICGVQELSSILITGSAVDVADLFRWNKQTRKHCLTGLRPFPAAPEMPACFTGIYFVLALLRICSGLSRLFHNLYIFTHVLGTGSFQILVVPLHILKCTWHL